MIKLSKHTNNEMGGRGISRTYIKAAVISPDRATDDPTDPALVRSYKAIAEFGSRVLRVVHRPDGADRFVVTAHWAPEA
jgi:hypothetical protein